jgi:hypothetical protein
MSQSSDAHSFLLLGSKYLCLYYNHESARFEAYINHLKMGSNKTLSIFNSTNMRSSSSMKRKSIRCVFFSTKTRNSDRGNCQKKHTHTHITTASKYSNAPAWQVTSLRSSISLHVDRIVFAALCRRNPT